MGEKEMERFGWMLELASMVVKKADGRSIGVGLVLEEGAQSLFEITGQEACICGRDQGRWGGLETNGSVRRVKIGRRRPGR